MPSCSCSAVAVNPAPDGKRPQHPIEAEFIQIILGNFHKLRLDLNLYRRHSSRPLHDGIDQIHGSLSVSHDELASRSDILGKCTSWKRNPLLGKILCGIAATSDACIGIPCPLSTGEWTGRKALSGRGGDKSGWHAVFFGDQIFGIFGDWDDRNCEGLDFILQIGKHGQITNSLDEGNIF